MKDLLHIVAETDWNQVDGTYHPQSLEVEGFIHCSTVDNVLIPANERFLGRRDLLLIVIDQSALCAPVIVEDCEERGVMFPHIYGPLELTAVKHVYAFRPDDDGYFTLPQGLKSTIGVTKS
jgi:uncharacterized protein (DUF952 family)